MRKIIAAALVAFSVGLFVFSQVEAHDGETNSQGCHEEVATGGYHCH